MSNSKSLLGINWVAKEHDPHIALAIEQQHGISKFLAEILAQKKLELKQIENFLAPTLRTSFSQPDTDPFKLLDMKAAIAKIIEAITHNRKIAVFADYDVDGACSAALLKRFFRAIKIEIEIYVPDRILEGYGPNSAAFLKLKQQGIDLIITVDCGTTAFEPLLKAKELGLEIIVIDHHLGNEEKPEAVAVINPNRIDETFAHKNLCAAGVVFLLLIALNKTLREQELYKLWHVEEPNLLRLLDLVALATVCDVMSLTELNRAFVKQGLKLIKSRSNLGIKALFDESGLSSEPNSYTLGFVLGPRINAGGRVGRADLGARLLSSDDEIETKEIAAELERHNQERRDLEKSACEEALAQVENERLSNDPVILVASENWHPGVIGIVAARIKEIYYRPTAVISLIPSESGAGLIGKASGRSITGVDLGRAILTARDKQLVLAGGGHAMACGFSLTQNQIPELRDFFNEQLASEVAAALISREFKLAAELDLMNVNLKMANELMQLEPFGVANSRPKFLLRDCYKVRASIVGSGHVSCTFSSKTLTGFMNGIGGIAFMKTAAKNGQGGNQILLEMLLDPNFKGPMDVIAEVNINRYMGSEKVQLVIEDIYAK